MTLVHEALYKAESLATDRPGCLLSRLVDMLLDVYGHDRAEISTDLAHVQLSTAQAVPCGLILNELIATRSATRRLPTAGARVGAAFVLPAPASSSCP